MRNAAEAARAAVIDKMRGARQYGIRKPGHPPVVRHGRPARPQADADKNAVRRVRRSGGLTPATTGSSDSDARLSPRAPKLPRRRSSRHGSTSERHTAAAELPQGAVVQHTTGTVRLIRALAFAYVCYVLWGCGSQQLHPSSPIAAERHCPQWAASIAGPAAVKIAAFAPFGYDEVLSWGLEAGNDGDVERASELATPGDGGAAAADDTRPLARQPAQSEPQPPAHAVSSVATPPSVVDAAQRGGKAIDGQQTQGMGDVGAAEVHHLDEAGKHAHQAPTSGVEQVAESWGDVTADNSSAEVQGPVSAGVDATDEGVTAAEGEELGGVESTEDSGDGAPFSSPMRGTTASEEQSAVDAAPTDGGTSDWGDGGVVASERLGDSAGGSDSVPPPGDGVAGARKPLWARWETYALVVVIVVGAGQQLWQRRPGLVSAISARLVDAGPLGKWVAAGLGAGDSARSSAEAADAASSNGGGDGSPAQQPSSPPQRGLAGDDDDTASGDGAEHAAFEAMVDVIRAAATAAELSGLAKSVAAQHRGGLLTEFQRDLLQEEVDKRMGALGGDGDKSGFGAGSSPSAISPFQLDSSADSPGPSASQVGPTMDGRAGDIATLFGSPFSTRMLDALSRTPARSVQGFGAPRSVAGGFGAAGRDAGNTSVMSTATAPVDSLRHLRMRRMQEQRRRKAVEKSLKSLARQIREEAGLDPDTQLPEIERDIDAIGAHLRDLRTVHEM